jgi:hypothetical protein
MPVLLELVISAFAGRRKIRNPISAFAWQKPAAP